MSKIDAKQIYLQIKGGGTKYVEEIHCPMILTVMNEEGTMTAFCKKAGISKAAFYRWIGKYKHFRECYDMGMVFSRDNWEQEGETGKNEEFFNFDHWRLTGAMRYGVGKNRVRMGINPKSDPYKQYQELVALANTEEFNASEVKQLMESINVGIRAFETFKMQEQLDIIKDDLARMGVHSVNNSNSIEKAAKTD
jgi:hypothetical protein